MAHIIQCKICDRPFQSTGGLICHSCLEQIDLDFITIRDYLYDNPGNQNVDDISEATEVPKKVIMHLLKEKRLTVKDPTGGSLVCEVCRRPIENGRMCDDCRASLSKTLAGSLTPPSSPKEKTSGAKQGPKMHIDHGKR